MRKILKRTLGLSVLNIYESFRDRKNEIKQIEHRNRLINNYYKNNVIKKIQIGCGTNVLVGWLNTDIKSSNDIAFLDAGDKFPIKSNTFDYVYSEHLFEHLEVKQQINMLMECFRILKKGGVLRIATPSLDFLFELYANPNTLDNKKYVEWAVKNIPNLKIVDDSILNFDEYYTYVINNFFKAWGHKMIHNYSSIKELALQCEYDYIRKCKVGESEVSHLQSIEKHGTIIPEKMNLIETMVVEIIK